MYGVFMVVFVVVLIVGAWWLLRRALNGDEKPEAGGSFGDLALGETVGHHGRRVRWLEVPHPDRLYLV